MIPARLSFITFGATDVTALRTFYEGWGWTAGRHSTENYASFSLGTTTLAIHPRELLAAEAAPGEALSTSAVWNGITLALNVDERDDVDPTFQNAVTAGARSVSVPADRDWGGRSGYIADPEGNRWEIAWAPGWSWPLDE